MKHKLDIHEDSYISLDGKTSRGSERKESSIESLHLLHAYNHKQGLVIGQ